MNLDWVTLFWVAFKAAILSSNGMTNLPGLREELVPRGWATDRDFAEAFAVGGITPGPNGLWVVSLGYLIGGWLGARIGKRLPPVAVRLWTLGVTAVTTIVFFARAYG